MLRYVPDFIRHRFAQGKLQGSFKGFVLLLDIVDFTGMVEKLQGDGQDGADGVGKLLNAIMRGPIAAIYRQGGFVNLFVGDAISAIFEAEASSNVQAALTDIRRAVDSLNIGGELNGGKRLALKEAVTYGEISWQILTNDHQYDFLFSGEPIIEAGRLLGANRQSSISDTAKAMFDIDARSKVQQPSVELRDQTALADRDANSFLHKRLRGLGAGNQIRSIAPCFVNLGSASDLSAALRHIHILADRHHGYVNKIEYTDKGIVVLILFGVPLSDGRSLTQAVDFAVDALELLPKISIGISCGYAFAGWVGSDEVKEYTALGHPLNIAARLMHRAKKGEALCDNNVWLQMHEPYDLIYMSSIKLKGVAKPIRYHRIMRRRLMDRYQFKHSFVGREREMAELNMAITTSIHDKRSRIIYISGEPGQGKSRLAYECMQGFKSYPQLIVNCREDARRPLEAIAQIVKQLLGMSDKEDENDLKAEYQRNFEALFAEATLPKPELSALASLLGISFSASVWEATEPGMRAQKQEQAFLSLLRYCLSKEPLLIMLDDAQWLDAHSLALIRRVYTEHCEALLILAPSRFDQDGKALNLDLVHLDCQHLELERLGLKDAEILLGEILRVPSLPQSSCDLIYSRAGGNPFFLEQITMYLLESDLLDDRARLSGRLTDIPSFSISDVINSRIDGFTQSMQECLYHASVLGMMFNVKVLQQMLNQSIESNLQTGLQHKLWTGLSELQYMFSHIVLRDQIYRRMVGDKVLQLHRLAADALIKLYGSDGSAQSAEIAQHYESAEDYDAAIMHWIKAAQYAMQHGTWQEGVSCQRRAVILSAQHHGFGSDKHNQRLFWLALNYHYIQHYKTAEPLYLLALKRRIAMLGEDDSRLSPYLNNVGRFYKDSGRWDKAEDLLRKSLRIEHLKQARSSNVADRINNLASLFARMGLLKKAMSYSRQALKMFSESDHHERDYFVALLQNNIAALLIRMKNYEEAERYTLNALATMESAISETHPRAAHCHLNLFQIRFEQGRYQDAGQALEQASSRFRQFFGENNPDYARCLMYHGDLSKETNNPEGAAESWQKALDILKQTLAPDHPLLLEAQSKVAGISA